MMKKVILACAVLLSVTSMAQDKGIVHGNEEVRTLFGNTKPTGGFVSATAKSFYLNEQWGFGAGAEVAVVMGRKFNIGFSAYGLATDVFTPYTDLLGSRYNYAFGYGGLFVEPMIGSTWPIHVSFPITLGMGAVAESYGNAYSYSSFVGEEDLFLIADMGANVEFNIFKFLRLAGGINYRLTSDVSLLGGSPQQLSGIGGNISLKLGWF